MQKSCISCNVLYKCFCGISRNNVYLVCASKCCVCRGAILAPAGRASAALTVFTALPAEEPAASVHCVHCMHMGTETPVTRVKLKAGTRCSVTWSLRFVAYLHHLQRSETIFSCCAVISSCGDT